VACVIVVAPLVAAFKQLSDYQEEDRTLILGLYAQKKFSKTLPGLLRAFQQMNDPGTLFEIESGLFAQEYLSVNVLGFKLGFYFRDGYNTILNGARRVELIDTEYDVVTDKFLIESKWSYDMQPYNRVDILDQLIKEQTTAAWLDAVDDDLFSGGLKIQYFLSKKGKPLFILRGKSTGGRTVVLECSWVTGHTECVCLQQFIKAIKAVANKKPVTFFKSCVGSYVRKKMIEGSFDFYEHVEYLGEFVRINDCLEETQDTLRFYTVESDK
jgi:hypothetical protein